jgi:hypothetical protein
MPLLKQIFASNFKTKVMALFMAVAVWTYAYFFSLQKEVDRDIPLLVRVPEGWSVIEQDPAAVTVTLAFPTHSAERIKDALTRRAVWAEVEADVETGSSTQRFAGVLLSEENFHLPAGTGARALSWQPRKVNFVVVQQKTRDLPVRLNLSDPPPGHKILDIWWMPRTVSVKGPAEALDRADFILTEKITIVPPPKYGEAPRSTIGVLQFIEADGKRFDIVCKNRIEYVIFLSPKLDERVFEKVRIRALVPPGYPYAFKLKQEEMRVTIRGPEKELAALKPEDILLFVDIRDLTPQELPYSEPVRCIFASGTKSELFEVQFEQPNIGVDIRQPKPD